MALRSSIGRVEMKFLFYICMGLLLTQVFAEGDEDKKEEKTKPSADDNYDHTSTRFTDSSKKDDDYDDDDLDWL